MKPWFLDIGFWNFHLVFWNLEFILISMHIEHIAIYTNRLEEMKDFYMKYFGGVPNQKYSNPTTGFESYLLQFASGTRLEL
ncbi:hypothetical protein NL529_30770, partial [Klebsiella pneumoniae]|nr:hypothetical protein [Klebsiella pneumoniae]